MQVYETNTMKKNLHLFALCFFLAIGSTFAQIKKVAQDVTELKKNHTKFEPISIFDVNNDVLQNKAYQQLIPGAETFQLDIVKLKDFSAKGVKNIVFEVPYNGQNLQLEMYEVDIFDEFKATDENFIPIPYTKGKFYRGILRGDETSLVTLNVFEKEVSALISSPALGNLNLGKLENTKNNYIIYNDSNLPDEAKLGAFCGADALDQPKVAQVESLVEKAKLADYETTKCTTIFFEIDYDIYTRKQKDVTQVLDWVTGLFNNVQTLYTNDNIKVALRQVLVWTTQDPYQNIGTSSIDYLRKFQKERPYFDADVGQLIGIDPGGLGGVAYVNALCSDYNYSYSDVNITYADVPTYSWNVMVVTHELGHNLGSPHTHSCSWNDNNTAIDSCYTNEGSCQNAGIPSDGGTIMSYCHLQSVGINLANGFGPQPRQKIIDSINGKPCLSGDCSNICITTIEDYTLTKLSDTSMEIELGTLDDAVYEWEYTFAENATAASSDWKLNANNKFIVKDLKPNTYYRLRVKKKCDLTKNRYVDVVFMTDGNLCGEVFKDAKLDKNYGHNENWTRTILPLNPASKVRLDFTKFKTEAKHDYIYIYDGIDTNAPLLIKGSGVELLDKSFLATNEKGALTVKFTSDATVVSTGWEADVTCSFLGMNDVDQAVNYSFYPNPVKNQLTITSKSPILTVKLFSIDGKLLLTKAFSAVNEAKIDTSTLPNGVYMVHVKQSDQNSSFKITKK